MRLRLWLSPGAKAQIVREDVWWQTNRTKAPNAFWEEFHAAIATLREFPETGLRVRGAFEGMRTVLLPTSRYHVYYWIDDQRRLRVYAVWSGQRGRRPALPKRKPA